MNGLRTAVSFLTVLPAGEGAWQPARAVPWYPVVGGVLAAVVACGVAVLDWAFPPLLAGTLGVGMWAVLTGALHLDGLADTADAAFAPVSRERRLEILADVHHGTFAVVGVALVLLIKVAALGSLEGRSAAAGAAFAIVVARGLLPLVMRAFAPARPGGMGAAAHAGATPAAVSIGVLVAVVVAAITFSWAGVIIVAGVAGGMLAAAAWLSARFGGLTGDCYGAIIEVGEVASLVTIAALASHGHLLGFALGTGG